nr:hypothetical protein [uncultured Desulfuromonas sp.]
MIRHWLILVLCCLTLSACGRPALPPHAAGVVEGLEAQQLVTNHWLSGTNRYLCRQSGVLKLRWREVPLQGVLRIDGGLHEARLVAMDSMGVKLFDLSVTPDDMTLNYLLPLLEDHPQLPKVVADSVRRIFLTPQPTVADRLQPRVVGQPYRLDSATDDGTVFTFGGDPIRLQETRVDVTGEDWQVDYFDYAQFGALWVPRMIVLDDENYRLTLWMEEVRQL